MTLITGVVNQFWVALASDRRLTSRSNTGELIWQEDATNKAVMVEGRYVIALAGVVPGGGDVETWLLDRLVERRRTRPLVQRLKAILSAEWDAQPQLHGSPVAVVGVGFHPLGPKVVPSLFIVSNAIDGGGNYNPHRVGRHFRIHSGDAKNANQGITAGFDVHNHDLKALLERAATVPVLDRDNLLRFGQALAEFHEDIASQSDGAVGRDFMMTCFPMKSAGVAGFSVPLAANAVSAENEAISITWDSASGQFGPRYMPALIQSEAQGGMVFGGAEMWTGSPPKGRPRRSFDWQTPPTRGTGDA